MSTNNMLCPTTSIANWQENMWWFLSVWCLQVNCVLLAIWIQLKAFSAASRLHVCCNMHSPHIMLIACYTPQSATSNYIRFLPTAFNFGVCILVVHVHCACGASKSKSRSGYTFFAFPTLQSEIYPLSTTLLQYYINGRACLILNTFSEYYSRVNSKLGISCNCIRVQCEKCMHLIEWSAHCEIGKITWSLYWFKET